MAWYRFLTHRGCRGASWPQQLQVNPLPPCDGGYAYWNQLVRHRGAFATQCLHGDFVQIEMAAHQIWWCQRQPLIEGYILVERGVENIQHSHRCFANIFDVMGECAWHIVDITRAKIERSGLVCRVKHGHPGFTTEVVLLLVSIRMSVNFPQCTRLQIYDKRGHIGDRKILGINNGRGVTLPWRRFHFSRGMNGVGIGGRLVQQLRLHSSREGGTGRRKIYFSFFGRLAKCSAATPKFFAITSCGICAINSVTSRVSFSEKLPSSKTSRNSQPPSNPWME